jgi:hypothetical protein
MEHPTHHEIQVAAFYIWQNDGEKIPGEDLRDWFEAEMMLKHLRRPKHPRKHRWTDRGAQYKE